MSSYIRLFGTSKPVKPKKKIRFFINGAQHFLSDNNEILLGRGFGFRIKPVRLPRFKMPRFKTPRIKLPNFKTGSLRMPQFNGGKFFGGITHGISSGISDFTGMAADLALAPVNFATGITSEAINSGMGLLQTANPLLNAASSILSPNQQSMDDGSMQPMDDGSMQPMDDGSMQPMDDGSMQPMDDGSMQPMDDGSMQPMDDGSMQPMDDGSSLEGKAEIIEERSYADSLDTGEYGL